MNLLELRLQFRSISGRFDLVEEDGTDTGANFYINAGQRHLDRMDETQKSWGIAHRFCEVNRYSAQFNWCRAVKEVWAATTVARWQLEKMNLQDLIASYFTTPSPAAVYGTILKSGVTTGFGVNKLIDAGGGLIVIPIASVVIDGSGNTTYVTAIDSDTQLSIGSNIFAAGEAYTIYSRATAGISVGTGSPIYYSPTITRAAPETFNTPANEFEAFSGYVNILSGDHFAYNSVLIGPPTNEKIQLEIKGLFYTDQLTADTDKSYWSEVHPDVLIMAAMRHIEVINRNTQGVNDWDKAISAEVSGIGKDLVEELIAEVTQIEN